MKRKYVYVVSAIGVAVLIAGAAFFLLRGDRVQQGVVAKMPTGISNDAGRKIVIKNAFGVETAVTIGGVFARNEQCGEVIGSLKEGAKVEYRLLPSGAFCAYDGKTSLENVYIKVIP